MRRRWGRPVRWHAGAPAAGRAGRLLAVLIPLAGCGGSSTTSTTGAPTATASATLGTPAVTASAAPTTSVASPTPQPPSACAAPAAGAIPAHIAASFPTALAFAPDGRLFYTERAGTVRVWQGGASHVFASVPTVTAEAGGGYSERGLLGLAISPTFARDRLVFAFYSDVDRTHQRVIRWRDCAGTGTDAQVIVTLPSGFDCCHKGGRLAFDASGRLLVTLGEEHASRAAQDTGDVRGKVLRYNPDGSVPGDNPFGPSNPVWAYGLRNPFGIAVSPSGQVAVTSNGPSGDAGSPRSGYDLVFLSVQRGGGYQWPLCYGYSHPLAASTCGGQHGPDWSSEQSTVIPAGAAFVDASGPAPYAGHLVLCSYAAGMLVVTPGSPATVAAGAAQCRLDVKQGPDHALYVAATDGITRLG